MSYLYPTFSGPAGALVQDPAPIVTVNGQRLRITKVHATEGIAFDRLGDEPAEGQAETVIESACGMIGGTFADLAAVIAHMQNPPAPVVAPRKQSARVVLGRLTDAEYTALTTSPVVGIQRALETARIEAVISEADPDFTAFVGGCHALGIIAANRWDALLAP